MKTRMRLGYAWPVLLVGAMGCWSLKPAEDLPDVDRSELRVSMETDVGDAPDVSDAPDADVVNAFDADVVDVLDADVTEVLATVECSSPLVACNDRCTDPRDDRENCGTCGRACTAGQVCTSGACGTDCSPGTTNCGGACVSTLTNSSHCGVCGRVCTSGLQCRGGVCVALQRSCAGTPTSPGCGVVTITGGSFTMGEASMARKASPVQPNVTVGSFAIDAYEVTVARFNAYWSVRAAEMATVRASPIRYRGGMIAWQPAPNAEPNRQSQSPQYNWLPTSSPRDFHPMNGVDYWMAQEFCVWDGGRLPTEAEWEYAARGAARAGLAAGRIYPWGDTEPTTSCDRAQWNSCAGTDGASTRRVGSFPTGATGGVFDLAGNVYEWVADNPSAYSTGGAADPCANRSGTNNPLCNDRAAGTRMIRGGSWEGPSVAGLRSASRRFEPPASRDSNIGFRCGWDIP